MTVTQLTADIRVGPPQTSGALTVYPLFREDAPVLEYRSFAQAAAEGFVVHEVQQGASVRDLTVTNALDVPVLLYDGEELLGAQQNRTLDITVLVPARSKLQVPVSCVEAGRWDGTRHGEDFAPAPQAAYPSLRAMKARQSSLAAAAGGELRAVQSAVWDEVAAKSARRGATSATGAMHDMYENDRAAIARVVAAIDRQDRQVGAVAVIDGFPSVVDYVSRSDVWAALHGPLVQGYALDALDGARPRVAQHDGAVVDQAHLQAWITNLVGAGDIITRPAPGLGRSIAIDACDAAAAGCVYQDELIQLSAFPAHDEPVADPSRIRRPSRRR